MSSIIDIFKAIVELIRSLLRRKIIIRVHSLEDLSKVSKEYIDKRKVVAIIADVKDIDEFPNADVYIIYKPRKMKAKQG